MGSRDNHLFVNILTTLKSSSDLKWTLKPFRFEQCTPKSQLSNRQKKVILEHKIKLIVQEVCNILYFIGNNILQKHTHIYVYI